MMDGGMISSAHFLTVYGDRGIAYSSFNSITHM
jgi:hypothetical protein